MSENVGLDWPDNTRWHAPGAMMLVIVVCAVGLFLPTVGGEFVYDDNPIVRYNPMFNGEMPWYSAITAPWWPPERSMDPLFRPVTAFTFRVNSLFGLKAWHYLMVNVGLHAINSAIVGFLAMTILRSDRAGWFAGLLFAVHPIHSEAVCLIVGRAELLSTLFILLLVLYRVKHPPGTDSPLRSNLIMVTLFAFAIFSKEHAVFIYPVLFVLDLVSCRGDKREYINRCLKSWHFGLLLALAFFFFCRYLLFGYRTSLPTDFVDPYANPLPFLPLLTQILVPFRLLFLVFEQWFYPVHLCPVWGPGSFPLPDSLSDWRVLSGIAILSIMLFLIVRRKTTGIVVFSLLVFLLLPCHFIPAINWLFAERWLYAPSVALTLLTTVILLRLGRIPGMFVFGMVLTLCARLTWDYQRSWNSNESLMGLVITKQPMNYHGLADLVVIRYLDDRLMECEPCIRVLQDQYPNSKRTWYWTALYEYHHGDGDNALDAIEKLADLLSPGQLPDSFKQMRMELQQVE